MFGGIKIAAVAVAALAAFAVQYAWFTLLFAEPYRAGLGRSAEQLAAGPSLPIALTMQFGGNVASAAVLAWLIDRTDMEGIGPSSVLAGLCWLGFVAAVMGPMYAFQAYSPSFFLITSGGVLAGLLVMGGILGVWK